MQHCEIQLKFKINHSYLWKTDWNSSSHSCGRIKDGLKIKRKLINRRIQKWIQDSYTESELTLKLKYEIHWLRQRWDKYFLA